MKTHFRLSAELLTAGLIALFACGDFGGSSMAWAQDKATGAYGQASRADQSAPKSTPDLTPDTVVLQLPAEENQPALDITLKQLMDTYKVPGLSVAVIDNYQIAWAKGFGVTEGGGSTPVTAKTLFQAGSISKPVAAVGTMWLVEHGNFHWMKTSTRG